MSKSDDKTPIWRPPTRRNFIAMLAAAAAAVAVRDKAAPKPKPIWIGHC